VWRVRVGTGMDGQGRDGPWKGAAELRRKRTRGVSKWGGVGRNIRLDAAALERRVRGLASGGRRLSCGFGKILVKYVRKRAHMTQQPVVVL
jgi:hypothetical protein